jgi:RimJ/RimL family protein N-acetyltransferase
MLIRQPTLTTERLTLRPFRPSDAPEVVRLASDFKIADTTRNIPHPYPPDVAERWIASHAPRFEAGTLATFAIVRSADATLLGAVGLVIERDDRRAELGYWLGVPYWKAGYMTEAARALVGCGFAQLELHRILATHITRNPASGRVMQKIGMRYEGTLREHVLKWGTFEDLAQYAILRAEWAPGPATADRA